MGEDRMIKPIYGIATDMDTKGLTFFIGYVPEYNTFKIALILFNLGIMIGVRKEQKHE